MKATEVKILDLLSKEPPLVEWQMGDGEDG